MDKLISFFKRFSKRIVLTSLILAILNFLPAIVEILPSEADSSVQEDIKIIKNVPIDVDGHKIVIDHISKFQITIKDFESFINNINTKNPDGYIFVGLGLEEKNNQGLPNSKFKFGKECLRVSGISWENSGYLEIESPILGVTCGQIELSNRLERDSVLFENGIIGFKKSKEIGLAYKISDAKIFLNKLLKEKRQIVYLDFNRYNGNQNILFSNVPKIRTSNINKKNLKLRTVLNWLRLPPGDNDLYGDKGQNCCQ